MMNDECAGSSDDSKSSDEWLRVRLYLFKKVNGFEEKRETSAAEQEQEEGYHDEIRFI